MKQDLKVNEDLLFITYLIKRKTLWRNEKVKIRVVYFKQQVAKKFNQ